MAGSGCSHCGKQGAALKPCSRCKEASYGGTERQKVGWKLHKQTCAPPPSLRQISDKIQAACAGEDWREALEWEGRMEEVMEWQSDATSNAILSTFIKAHMTKHRPYYHQASEIVTMLLG